MSRSGCKESKVATGAFAAPTRQHQHTPSEYGRRTRCSERPAPPSPPHAEEMENGVEKKERYHSSERRENDGCADTEVAPFNREIFFFSIFHDEFDVFTPSHQSERVDLFGHAQDELFGHAQDPPPT